MGPINLLNQHVSARILMKIPSAPNFRERSGGVGLLGSRAKAEPILSPDEPTCLQHVSDLLIPMELSAVAGYVNLLFPKSHKNDSCRQPLSCAACNYIYLVSLPNARRSSRPSPFLALWG